MRVQVERCSTMQHAACSTVALLQVNKQSALFPDEFYDTIVAAEHERGADFVTANER